MLWTALGLAAVTLLAVRGHLRRAPPVVVRQTRRCPRCAATTPAGAEVCPSCAVPLQIYELVNAPIVQPDAAADSAPPRALVRADLCVGCGACAAACPQPGALMMRGKLAVVDPALCQGHGECIPACPLGAIAVSRGGATNRVVAPDLDGNFETNVAGVYVVGELGGRALIKNAVNEGRVAAEDVVARASARRHVHPGNGIVDVVIAGSGPAGLSAALTVHAAGLDYVLLEQGTLADTVRRYPRHKILFSEPLTMPLYGDLWVSDASKEHLLAIWDRVIAHTGLRVTPNQRVSNAASVDGIIIVRTATTEIRTRALVLALGRRGTPRRLGVPGEDLPTVVYDVAEMSAFAGRRVLVVGGGDSAIESALGLARQDGTTVTLSYRGTAFSRVKDRNRARLDAAVADGSITVRLASEVRELRAGVAVLVTDGTQAIVPCDDVIVRIGGEPSTVLLDQLGIRMVTKELPPPRTRESSDAA